MTYTIKTTKDVYDSSDECLGILIPTGTIIEAEKDFEYFIVEMDEFSVPVLENECEVLQEK